MFNTSAGLVSTCACTSGWDPKGVRVPAGLACVHMCTPVAGTPESYLLVCMERSGMRTDMRMASVMSMYRRWESPGGRRTRKTLPCSQSRKVFSSVHLT